ncbi:MAG: prepilin-type N-terminal cleavage/methylation domain-containing protein, partial [Planctomycetota bacterium]|nr:prepilin-type N-terminal cleavage/methylation domain-containing protein [Planctomycetota bacterium]
MIALAARLEPRATRGPGTQGFTLLELLMVMGLIGILIGTGLGLLAGLSPGKRAVAGMIEETLRLSQRSAAVLGTPARVEMRGEQIQAQIMRPVGTWHFENQSLVGAQELEAVWLGASDPPFISNGFEGHGFDLQAGAPGVLEISVASEPAFDWADGFSIRCAVRVKEWQDSILMQLGQGMQVALSSHGALGVEFRAVSTDEAGHESRGPRVAVQTETGVMTPGRWVRVEIVYDRNFLRILVDGIERVRRSEIARVWIGEPSITVSSKSRPFPGVIDRLVFHSHEMMEPKPLPGGAIFLKGSPTSVVFAPGGGLDPLMH